MPPFSLHNAHSDLIFFYTEREGRGQGQLGETVGYGRKPDVVACRVQVTGK